MSATCARDVVRQCLEGILTGYTTESANALCLNGGEGASAAADDSARARAIGVDGAGAGDDAAGRSARGAGCAGGFRGQRAEGGSQSRLGRRDAHRRLGASAGAGASAGTGAGAGAGASAGAAAAVAGDGAARPGSVLGDGHGLEHGLGLLLGGVDGEGHALTTVAILTAVEP